MNQKQWKDIYSAAFLLTKNKLGFDLLQYSDFPPHFIYHLFHKTDWNKKCCLGKWGNGLIIKYESNDYK